MRPWVPFSFKLPQSYIYKITDLMGYVERGKTIDKGAGERALHKDSDNNVSAEGTFPSFQAPHLN